MLNAMLELKKAGLINTPHDAKYLGCHGADYVFGLVDGSIVAVDLVINKIRINGV